MKTRYAGACAACTCESMHCTHVHNAADRRRRTRCERRVGALLRHGRYAPAPAAPSLSAAGAAPEPTAAADWARHRPRCRCQRLALDPPVIAGLPADVRSCRACSRLRDARNADRWSAITAKLGSALLTDAYSSSTLSANESRPITMSVRVWQTLAVQETAYSVTVSAVVVELLHSCSTPADMLACKTWS